MTSDQSGNGQPYRVALVKIWHGPRELAVPPLGLLFISQALKKLGIK